MKGIIQKIYGKTINSAINGYTNYTVALSCLEHYELFFNKEHYILELLTELHSVFPDSTIQYAEKNIYDIQENKMIIPCIVIDWS